MSTLRDAIADYLRLRRGLGFKLAAHARLLASFADYLDQAGIPTITTAAALGWATQPQGAQPAQWKARLCVVRGFARYLATLDPLAEVPPADLLASRRQRPAPYLFSPAEITALLAAAGRLRSPLQAVTYPALVGLIANAGLRLSEAIRLDDGDADMPAGLLRIRDTTFGKVQAAAAASHHGGGPLPLRPGTGPALPPASRSDVRRLHHRWQAHRHHRQGGVLRADQIHRHRVSSPVSAADS